MSISWMAMSETGSQVRSLVLKSIIIGIQVKQDVLGVKEQNKISRLEYLIDVTIAYEKPDECDLIAITGGGKVAYRKKEN